MISIVICSRDDQRFRRVAEKYAVLLKDEPFEIIRIPDARGLCEGYARGFARSRGEHVIFSHDDIEILSPDFAPRLRRHLEQFDLVGVAGTNRLIRGEWVVAGPPYIFGQVAQPHAQMGFVVMIFGVGRRSFGGIQAMDGLFFAARREVVEKVGFDARTFDSFHHYDLDFSFSAYLAGFRLGIACDLFILHQSGGRHDEAWQRSAQRFQQKFAGKLYPMTQRQYTFALVGVPTREEIVEVMAGGIAE
jgi:GT2 family glycosyltransferase